MVLISFSIDSLDALKNMRNTLSNAASKTMDFAVLIVNEPLVEATRPAYLTRISEAVVVCPIPFADITLNTEGFTQKDLWQFIYPLRLFLLSVNDLDIRKFVFDDVLFASDVLKFVFCQTNIGKVDIEITLGVFHALMNHTNIIVKSLATNAASFNIPDEAIVDTVCVISVDFAKLKNGIGKTMICHSMDGGIWQNFISLFCGKYGSFYVSKIIVYGGNSEADKTDRTVSLVGFHSDAKQLLDGIDATYVRTAEFRNVSAENTPESVYNSVSEVVARFKSVRSFGFFDMGFNLCPKAIE